ncbi:MAG: glycosyltransferase family 39 protein [Thermoplasmata archaeon]|nr:glycosyltransferase family 39 protein [Thermoplasmata archaeon]
MKDFGWKDKVIKIEKFLITHFEYLIIIWLLGFLLRVYFSSTSFHTFDFIKYRLPLAQLLSDGKILYRDVAYDHYPIFPYLSALFYSLGPNTEPHIQAVLVNFPAIIGDSLVAVVLFKIFRSRGFTSIALWSSIFYAFNPVSMLQMADSRFDGLAILFMLLAFDSMLKNNWLFVGIWAGIGFCTKQLPIIILFIYPIYHHHNFQNVIRAILTALGTILAILGYFIVYAPEMFGQIYTHVVYTTEISTVMLIGTFKYFIEPFGPLGTIIWGVIFVIIVLIILYLLLKFELRLFEFLAVVFLVLGYLIISPSRPMSTWVVVFLCVLLAKNFRFYLVPFLAIFLAYFIKLHKPTPLAFWGGLALIIAVLLLLLLLLEIRGYPQKNDFDSAFSITLRKNQSSNTDIKGD